MCDIGFAELLLIGVLALLVLGPERFPACIRTLGSWMGSLRRSWEELRTELEELEHPNPFPRGEAGRRKPLQSFPQEPQLQEGGVGGNPEDPIAPGATQDQEHNTPA